MKLRLWFVGFMIVGLILRLSQYLFNRSLWLDEAKLALNIINKPFLELLRPLDSSQAAPMGFLFIEKFIVLLAGSGEYALRLFPLLSGVLAMMLFYKVASYYLKEKACLFAVGLFVISDGLIYYASEVKQYSSDVLAALLLYLMAIRMMKKMSVGIVAVAGIVGATAVWCSYPAIFVLAGFSLSFFIFSVSKPDLRQMAVILLLSVVWAGSFLVYHRVSLSGLTNSSPLLTYWRESFLPFPPAGLSDWVWMPKTYLMMFRDTASIPQWGIAAVMFLIGFFYMARENKKSWAILVSSVPFVLIASALQLFPIRGRAIFFLVPVILILIAKGVEVLFVRTTARRVQRIGVFILAALLVAQPITSAFAHLIEPRTKEELRHSMEYIQSHMGAGDLIYLHHGSGRAFEYYAEKLVFNYSVIKGISSRYEPGQYERDLIQLEGASRVWFLISHSFVLKGVSEEDLFINILDRRGRMIDAYRFGGASAYLYDLS
jgi:hypothetical protein